MSTVSGPVEFDVVVVGSGGAAMAGALLAAKAGLSTAVVEKTSRVGGTSAYSGGACWLPGSAVQRRTGLADSTESARAYLDAVLERPDSAKVEAFLDRAPTLVDELEADPALEFEWIPFPEYFAAPGRVGFGRSIQPVDVRRDELPPEVDELLRPPVDRDRAGRGGRRTLSGGQSLIARLLAAFLREGGAVLDQHAVVDLVEEGGRVVGVDTAAPRGPVRISARKGVLLASGGFEGNGPLREKRGVPGDAAWSMAPEGTNTGEPMEAAERLGAATSWLDQGWFCPGLAQPDGGGSFTLGFRGGLVVDATGNRYANECLPYDRFGREMAAAEQRVPSWFVFDSREGGRLPAIAMPEGEPDEHLAAGTWVRADTIPELAAKIGVPADALTATVDRFNGFAESGADADFGRGDDEYDTFFAAGDGPNSALVPLDRPPYCAARLVLSDLGTKGGLVTDTTARVLRADGSALDGLYAAGNSSASLTGSAYPAPGVPLGTGMVFASLAIRDLAG